MTAASRRAVGASAALVFTAVLSSTVSADHAWGDYHWARTANPFTIALGDNVTAVWDGHLQAASADWTSSNVLDTIIVAGRARTKQCKPEAGRTEVCNATYGRNGWLGIAQIWASGSHITQGAVKMNDTYFNTPQYNTSAWRQFVVCQEVGHIFGLDHQDEVFTNANLNTCMDYTNNPASNQEPNAHDYRQLEEIYEHLDTTTTVGADVPRGNGVDIDNPSEWGRLMESSHGGRTQTFERDFGQGRKMITHVIWAQPE
jgi:hypothetical protein